MSYKSNIQAARNIFKQYTKSYMPYKIFIRSITIIILSLFCLNALGASTKNISNISGSEETEGSIMTDLLSPITLIQPLSKKEISLNLVYYYEYIREYATNSIARVQEVDSYFSYGITSKLKFIAETPVYDLYIQNDELAEHRYGLSDIYLYWQYELYAQNQLYLYAMPLFSLPTGNYNYGIGNGRPDYGIDFMIGKLVGNLTLFSQLQYTRNPNKIDAARDIWSISFVPEYGFNDHWRAVIGGRLEKDTDISNSRIPFYLIAGIRYIANKTLTITPTVEIGYNKPCKDVKTSLWFYINF